jgi:hypothetical protein
MEGYMSAQKITHEIKLPLSLTIILGVMVFGLFAHIFTPVLKIDDALAASHGLTKADIRDVMNDCNGLINGKFIHIKCK